MANKKNNGVTIPVGVQPVVATLTLTNPDVAAKYNCTTSFERVVHVPGIYRGLLSNVTLAAADAMVRQGHQALALKPVDDK